MSQGTRLDFEPLTLDETAKRLGIPHARARRVLALVGITPEAAHPKRKNRTGKAVSRRATRAAASRGK